MSKAEAKDEHNLSEIGQIIVAAWFKALPDSVPDADSIVYGRLTAMMNELALAFSRVLKTPPTSIEFDPNRTNYKIVIPFPPKYTREELLSYLKRFHDNSQGQQLHDELGRAVLFGCGK